MQRYGLREPLVYAAYTALTDGDWDYIAIDRAYIAIDRADIDLAISDGDGDYIAIA